MYTQCPHCEAIFQLTTEQLKAANGEVRCGQCLTVFNGLSHLSDSIPSQSETAGLPHSAPAAHASEQPAHDLPSLETTQQDTADQDITNQSTADQGATDLGTTHVDTTNLSTTNLETTNQSHKDIFSEVVATASQHELPTEELDRFEAFLSHESQAGDETAESRQDFSGDDATHNHVNPDDLADTGNSTNAAVEDVLNDALNDVLNEDHFSPSDPSVSPDSIIPGDTLSGDTYSSNAFSGNPDTTKATDNTARQVDPVVPVPVPTTFAPEKGLPERSSANESTAPIDDTQLLVDDDFSEFHALSSDEPLPTRDNKPDFSANVIPPSHLKEMPSFAGGESMFDSNEAIIIEDTDLSPMGSPDFTDNLEPSTANVNEKGISSVDSRHDNQPADTDRITPAFTAETEQQSPSQEDVFDAANVPSLIMEDLQAAKAEHLRPPTMPWVIGSLVLMLALVLQVVYHSRDELARDADLRPWLIQMCQIANCSINQPYDIKQIEIIGREVRTHPTAPKALIASTTLINNASFVQPYPLLTVIFSDINGRLMARRQFTPREYLSNTVDLTAGMTPDLPVRIELELVDPGKAAVNYEFHADLDPRNTRPLT
ncbi:MAG: DUF3426 domain-containing protein [Ectothiorhodospiraceae bacterium]|nr:DUF3426 domain-containing protein [Ectothiorhodospiraceae bacterium]